MIKIKVIDLLNKIANKEELPQMVSYEGKKYHIDELEHFYVTDDRKALLEYIFSFLNDFDALMAELEIIEDKKIEKINIVQEKNIKNNWKWKIKDIEHDYNISTPQKIIADKINEIIDKINKE